MPKAPASPSPLAIGPAEFERLGRQALAMAARYLESREDGPVHRDLPEETRQQLMTLPLPSSGLAGDDVLIFLEETLLAYPLGNGSRRFFAWINPPAAPIGILADTLSTTVNATSDGFEHAGTYLQVATGRWLMELCGFPDRGSGGEDALALFLSGGSMATLTALAGARHRAAMDDGWDLREEGLQGGRERMMLYCSDQSHSSVQKAVELLGLGSRSLRTIPCDTECRLRVPDLEAAIESDLAAGYRPFCVVAMAGATNTGAIDPLDAIAQVCARYGLWFHVDGAYGALGRLDPAYAPLYRGIERADSLVMDPHKWLMTPVDCGVLLLRDAKLQREAFSLVPAYLHEPEPGGAPWAYEYMFPLTYANRVVKTWATLASLGRDGVGGLVFRCNDLARELGAQVEAAADLELLAPVSLSIVCFRVKPAGEDDETALNILNRRLIDRLCAEGDVFITSTELRGKLAIRACILHYEADSSDIEGLLAAVHQAAAEISA